MSDSSRPIETAAIDENHPAYAFVIEAADCLKKSAGNRDAINGCIFLFLNRAYESGLDADSICAAFGRISGNVLDRAQLYDGDTGYALEAYESLDAILEQQYPPRNVG